MSTITIDSPDKKITDIFTKMAEVLGVSFDVKKEKEIKYNPTFVKTIEDYRAGKIKPIKFDEEALRKLVK